MVDRYNSISKTVNCKEVRIKIGRLEEGLSGNLFHVSKIKVASIG